MSREQTLVDATIKKVRTTKRKDINAVSFSVAPSAPGLPIYEFYSGAVTLHLHTGQLQAWNSDKRLVFMIAGTQGGKTAFGPWWLAREILKHGAGDYIAATASYDLFKLKMLPALRETFEDVLQIGRYWAGDKIIEIKSPATGLFEAKRADDKMYARIILRSAESKGGLESASVKAAWLDEVGQDSFTLGSWEAIKRRLALSRGRVLGTTTPYNMGWLKQQIVDKAATLEAEIINFDSTLNPAFPKAEFDEARATMAQWKFFMFYRGLFTRPPGMIYSDFVDEYREKGGHKVKPFQIPEHWPRYVGIDPGVINTAKIWLAYDLENDVYYIYRESLGERKTAFEHAQEALNIAHQFHERVVKWAVGAKSEKYHREDWEKAGAVGVVEPPTMDVEEGIDRVITLFKQYRLLIFDNCYGTLDKLATYRRETGKDGEVLDKILNKERFHELDALRYVALAITSKQRRQLVAETQRYA